MRFNKRQGQFLTETIDRWRADGTITQDTANALKGSFTIRPFDWKRLARYSFVIAIVCVVIAVGALVADDFLVKLFERFFSAPDGVLSLFFAGFAAIVFYVGLGMRRAHPRNVFSSEAVLFIAVLLAAVAIGFLGRAVDNGSGHFSLLLLLAAVLYGVIGYWFGSKLVWVFSLLSLGSWFGAETGYLSGWGAYCLGMNYPLRFVLFGAALIAAALLYFKPRQKIAFLHKPTYVMGLLYLFIALWILSLFGNHSDIDGWYRKRTDELLFWSLLFGLTAVAAIWHGLKHDDSTARGFGLTFLFINLYTKYFEYFWNATHKAVFFLVLAVSFWLIGRKAEAVWNLEFIRKDTASRDDDGAETDDGGAA